MKRILAFLLSLSVILTCIGGLSISAFAADELQGSGLPGDPYLISSADDFALIENDLSAYYKQTADFTVTTPIAGIFTGVYDGDNHTINAAISVKVAAKGDGIGLFTAISGTSDTQYAEIKNLTLTGRVEATADSAAAQIGAFAGHTTGNYVKLTNLTNRAVVYSNISGDEAGGIIGRAFTNHIIVTNCKNYGYIKAWSYAGGIFGMGGREVDINTYTNCANLGQIEGATAGGMVAWAYSSTFNSCYNLGYINGSSKAAGLTPLINIKTEPIVANNFFNIGQVKGTTKAAIVLDADTNSQAVVIENAYNSYPGLDILVTNNVADNSLSNIYNVNANDTLAEAVTAAELEELDISDDFVLRAEIAESDLNKAIRFPQLKDNLVPKDAIVGSGAAADPYLISDGYQFNHFFGLGADAAVYTGKKYYHIVNDINLEGIGYQPFNTPQATKENSFVGYVYGVDFDGEPVQRTIDFGTLGSASAPLKGMTGSDASKVYTGAFVGITTTAEFKNLTLEGAMYVGTGNSGALVGYINGETIIDTVVNEMDIVSTAGLLGGIVGSNANAATQIINCVNNADIQGGAQNIGGILGSTSRAPKTFKNNKNTGHIKSSNYTQIGGLIGFYNGHNTVQTLTVEECVNEGIVESPKGYVGGIVGALNQTNNDMAANIIIKNSRNIGEIKGDNYVGGILGGSNYTVEKNKSDIDIIGCVNTGTIYATNQYQGGIAGSAFNSRISNCQNTGKLINTFATNHSYVGGVVGLVKILKSEGTFGMYNTFNAGEISYLGTRNAGLIGYIWKEVAAAANGVADYTVENCYAMGEFTTTGTKNDNGAVTANVYNAHDYANNKVYVKGFYTNAPYNINFTTQKASGCTTTTTITVSDSYTLGNHSTATPGYTKISSEELADLTNKQGSAFNDPTVWTESTNGYMYPQLVGNIYDVKATPVPSALSVSIVDGKYILTWMTRSEPSNGYKILINGVQFGNITSEKSLDITDAVIGKVVKINVIAVDSQEYVSEELEFSALFAGGVGSKDAPYVVSTKEQLALIKDYPDAYFVQDGDIKDVDFMIGVTKANPFIGSYDGAGFSIDVAIVSENSDLSSDNIGTGLFPYISGSAEIKDLTITGTIDSHTANTGAFVGVTLSDGFKLTGLNNYAAITADKRESAGIVGRAYKTGTISNCYNYGNIKSNNTASGIAGVLNAKTVLTNCGNYGDITGGSHVAGICAWSYNGLSNCFNVGKLSGSTAVGIVGQLQPHYNATTGEPTNMVVVENCYNAGTLEGNTAYGIAARATGRDGSYIVKGCYNAVDADYPICDLTDEFVNSFNETWSKATGVYDCFYLTADAEAVSLNAGATKVTTPAALEEIAFAESTAYSKSGNYKYPQLKDNTINSKYDDIEFVTISLDESALTRSSILIYRFDKTSYIQKGDSVTVYLYPNEFYSIDLMKGDASLGLFTKTSNILVEINEDTVISATEVEVEVGELDDMITGDNIFQAAADDLIEVDGEKYTRYVIVAGKVAKVSGLRVKEYGILMNLSDDDFTIETAKKQAKADDGKINENGWYGILIHSTDSEKGLVDGRTYYTRPYAQYIDKDGKTYTVYGKIQSFVLSAPAVAE